MTANPRPWEYAYIWEVVYEHASTGNECVCMRVCMRVCVCVWLVELESGQG